MEKKTILLILRAVILCALCVAAGILYINKSKETLVAAAPDAVSVRRFYDNCGLIVEGVAADVNSMTVNYTADGTEETIGYLQAVNGQVDSAEEVSGATAYEITLLDEAGEAVQSGEMFSCYISLPEELRNKDGNTYEAYRVENGTAEAQMTFQKGNDLVLTTDRNGVYVVVKLQPTAGEEEPVQAEAEVSVETDAEILPEDTETAEAGTEEQTETPSATPTPTPRPAEENPREVNEETTTAQNAADDADAAQGQNTQSGYYALGRVNVRAGMSTDDAVIMTLEKDTPIEVIGVAQGSEWALVKVGDRSGYVNIQFIGAR